MTNGSHMLITQRIKIDMQYIFKADKLKYNCNDQKRGKIQEGTEKFSAQSKRDVKKIKFYVWSEIRKWFEQLMLSLSTF